MMAAIPRANSMLQEIRNRVARNSTSEKPTIRGRISEPLAKRLVREDLGINPEDADYMGKGPTQLTGNPEIDTFDFYGVWLVVTASDHEYACMWECVGEMENLW